MPDNLFTSCGVHSNVDRWIFYFMSRRWLDCEPVVHQSSYILLRNLQISLAAIAFRSAFGWPSHFFCAARILINATRNGLWIAYARTELCNYNCSRNEIIPGPGRMPKIVSHAVCARTTKCMAFLFGHILVHALKYEWKMSDLVSRVVFYDPRTGLCDKH